MALLLLLDDNLMSADSLRRALERAGHTCRIETSLPEPLDAERVIVNLGSPTLDGPALIRAARASSPDIPIVGFCGHAETARREAAQAAGIDRLVTHSALNRDPLVVLAD